MAVSDLIRWLERYQPQAGGRGSAWAWAAGLHAGRWWLRTDGGYHLYAGPAGSVDYDTPVGATSASSATPAAIATFPGSVLDADTTYQFALRAVGRGGVEETNQTVALLVRTDGDGVPGGAAPNPPVRLQAVAVSGGRIVLHWRHERAGEQAAPATWRIYHDNGTGTMDYGTPLASIRGRRYRTSAYADGTVVQFAVRAVSAGDVEEQNTNTVTATADDSGPPDMDAPTLAAGKET